MNSVKRNSLHWTQQQTWMVLVLNRQPFSHWATLATSWATVAQFFLIFPVVHVSLVSFRAETLKSLKVFCSLKKIYLYMWICPLLTTTEARRVLPLKKTRGQNPHFWRFTPIHTNMRCHWVYWCCNTEIKNVGLFIQTGYFSSSFFCSLSSPSACLKQVKDLETRAETFQVLFLDVDRAPSGADRVTE